MMVRSARVDDLPAIARATFAQPLLVRYGVSETGLVQGLERGLAGGDGILVAEDDRVLGFAWFLARGGFGLGGYLKLISVAPGGESRGVGHALLQEVERAVAVEAKHLMLLVSEFNEAAQRFYRRRGYEQRGAFPGLVLPDVCELLFYKRLSK